MVDYASALYTQRRQGLDVHLVNQRRELIMLGQGLLGLFFLGRAQRDVHLQGGL